MELQAVSELMGRQAQMPDTDRQPHTGFTPRQRAMLLWGFIIMFGAVGLGVTLKILAKDDIHPAGQFTPYLSVIGVLLALFGMAVMCFPFLQMMSPGRRSRVERSQESEPTSRLQRDALTAEPPSVVERTTEILDPAEASAQVRDTTPQGT